MALISCGECGRDVSDKAHSCPNCGNPISVQQKTDPSQSAQASHKQPQELKGSSGKWLAVVVAIVGLLILFNWGSKKNEPLPPMPVEVKYRSALLGPGLVIEVRNMTSRHLSLIGDFRNLTTNQERSFRMDLSPNGEKSLGHLEGWVFSSGDIVNLTHHDYAPWSGTLP